MGELSESEYNDFKDGSFINGIDVDDMRPYMWTTPNGDDVTGGARVAKSYHEKDWNEVKIFKSKNMRGKGKIMSIYSPWTSTYDIPSTLDSLASDIDRAKYVVDKAFLNGWHYWMRDTICSPSEINSVWGISY